MAWNIITPLQDPSGFNSCEKAMKFFFLLCLIVAINVRSQAQKRLTTIPIQITSDLIFLQLSINDSEALSFLFDTAAGVSIADDDLIARIGLEITGSSRIRTTGKSIQAERSTNNTLEIGGIKLDSIPLTVIDLNHLSKYFEHRIDGIIGFDLLKRFVVDVNIDQMMMSIYDPTNFKYTGEGMAIKVEKLEANHFGVPVSFVPKKQKEEITLIFNFDTACVEHLVFHNQTLHKHDLLTKTRYKISRGFGADSTITRNFRTKLKSVSFAGKTWKRPSVVFQVDSISIRSKKGSIADGLIGQKILLNFNIVYDLSKETIYLQPTKMRTKNPRQPKMKQ